MHGVRLVVALILAVAAFQATARDVSLEQNAVLYARHEFERAEAEHRVDTEQLARTGKALELLKKQFEEERKKASASERKSQQAKARLEKAEQALDRAWKK